MTKNINFVSHKKSKLKTSGGKPQLPSSSALVEGEIAINYAEDVETLSIKNESGDVVTFSSDNYYTSQKLGSGFTNNDATVTEAIDDLNGRKLDASAYTPTEELWVSGTGLNAVVLKNSSGTASGDYSVAEGMECIASGNSSHAEGQGTMASDGYSHSEGEYTWASGRASHTEGQGTIATSNASHAEGQGTIATSNASHAEGQGTSATSNASHAEGYETLASGDHSHAEGTSTVASNYRAHAEGNQTIASGDSSHAEGNQTIASGDHSHAEGNSTVASAYRAHAEGNQTIASGDSSHAEGNQTIASGDHSHAEGNSTVASAYCAHAEGSYTTATSVASHAEGLSTSATSYQAHAEGQQTLASGNQAHAEGASTLASGNQAHAEGVSTVASGDSSHAEGERTVASGHYSHAEGGKTSATTQYAHSEGYETLASGNYSHAEGQYTIANNQSEHASGRYNVSSSASTTFGDSGNTLFSVGNGTANNTRHNAFEIRQNGDIYIASGGTDIKLQDNIGKVDVISAITPSNSGSTAPIATKVVAENELTVSSALNDLNAAITAHTADTSIHVTAAEKTMWNANGYYGICTTDGVTAAKTVDISGFTLNENKQVSVLFTNAFTVSNPTLNVSNTGAHAIKIYGSAIPMGKVDNNTILTMIYDGTNYNVISIESQAVPTSNAVDLGLPSGLLWCDHNVGASKPEEEGFFFSWGNVEGHNLNGTGSYDFGTSNTTEPYASSSGATISYPGSIAVGDAYDMARANMGAPWRLPTNTEFQELFDNCTNVLINQNGMNGRRFTSNINGNSIFFPAAGYYYGSSHYDEGSHGLYWSSVLYSAGLAYYLDFNSGGVYPQHYYIRFNGFSVRAVQ